MEMQQDERFEGPLPPTAGATRRRRFAGALGVTLTIALTLGVSAATATTPSPEPAAAKTITVSAGSAVSVSPADAAKLDAAFAEYRDCMREHGVELPEPVVVKAGDPGTGGTTIVGGASVSGGAQLPALDAGAFAVADEACSPILEAAGIKTLSSSSAGEAGSGPVLGAGGGVIGGAAVLGGVAGSGDFAAMVGPIRTYAACMRERGVDVPDPVVDEKAGTFELRLDVDPTTSDFRAADAACSDGSGFSFVAPVPPAGE